MPKYEPSVLVRGAGLAASIWTALDKAVQKQGGTAEDLHRLATPEGEELVGKIADLIVSAFRPQSGVYIVDLDADPFCPDGWTVDEHRKGGQMEWDRTKVALYLSAGQQDGKWIKGDKLRMELKEKPVFNACLLDHLLAHPELIPESWKGKAVFFWGTIYRSRSPGGDLDVRCLYCHGDGWHWHFSWPGHDFGSLSPAAVPAST